MVVDRSTSPNVSTIDVLWLVDSRATQHLTSDAINVVDHNNSFLGLDYVTVGNGSTLPIQCHGSSLLQAHGSLSVLKLSELLYTPHVS